MGGIALSIHPQDGDGRAGARDAAPGLDDRSAAVAGAELLDRGEGPGEAVRLMEISLSECSTRAVDGRGIELGQPERVEMLQLLVRERVVDLGRVDVARLDVRLREGDRGRSLGRDRPGPVAALDRRRILAPADPV